MDKWARDAADRDNAVVAAQSSTEAWAISPSSSGVVTPGRKGRPCSTAPADDRGAPPPVAA